MSANTWNAELYDSKHAFVTKYGEDLIGLLNVRPGMTVLDVGCGTGHLTKQIADSGAIVVGMDNAPSMIAKARAAHPDIAFIVGDASDFSVAVPFDAIFSNATLHWVSRAEDAARCMAAALKLGGRFVVELGGKGNIKGLIAAMQDAIESETGARPSHTWFYPSLGEYAPMLERHGLETRTALLFDRPTPLEGDDGLRNWFRMFRAPWLEALPSDGARERVFARVEETLRPTLFRDGRWCADYRRLRIVAEKVRSS